MARMSDVTRILDQIQHGDPNASRELLPLVYDELRRLAAQKLAQERPGQTLEATALVHEAYVRLVDRRETACSGEQHWENRRHFFAAAAESMRRILVENARRKNSVKHGGGMQRVDIDSIDVKAPEPGLDLVALDGALKRLSDQDPLKARLVELRYFAGLTGEQTAAILGISASSADRQWVFARAWLRRELGSVDPS